MNLKQLIFLKSAAGGVESETPIFFSAVGGNGRDFAKNTTNAYGTTISTTSAEGNTVTVEQEYNSEYLPTSYHNGFVCVGFDSVKDWVDEGSAITFSADINITENPAAVSTLDIYYASAGTAGIISDGKFTATLSKLQTANRYYLEIRCGGCSFTLSNCKLIKGEA